MKNVVNSEPRAVVTEMLVSGPAALPNCVRKTNANKKANDLITCMLRNCNLD